MCKNPEKDAPGVEVVWKYIPVLKKLTHLKMEHNIFLCRPFSNLHKDPFSSKKILKLLQLQN